MWNHELDANGMPIDGSSAVNGAAAVGKKRRRLWPWSVEERSRVARELREISDTHRSKVAAEGLRRIGQMYAID